MNIFKKLFKIYIVFALAVIFISCGKKNAITNSDFYNEIAALKETRNISYKILDAYKINNDNVSFSSNRLNVKYALKCNIDGELTYNFYNDTYIEVGCLEERNIDIFLKTVDNISIDGQAKLLAILICDQAFRTKLFNKYGGELSTLDLISLDGTLSFQSLLLSDIIKQLRGKRDFKYQLSNEELDKINKIKISVN